jgi:hypothetical protein
MEIAIAGEGEVTVRFIDQNGQTLMQEKIAVAGSPTVQARRIIALWADTASGRVPLAPVLVRYSNPHQRVTFDGEDPARFTRKRCEEIACPSSVAEDAGRGCAAPLAPDAAPVLSGEDQVLARLVQAVGRRDADKQA